MRANRAHLFGSLHPMSNVVCDFIDLTIFFQPLVVKSRPRTRSDTKHVSILETRVSRWLVRPKVPPSYFDKREVVVHKVDSHTSCTDVAFSNGNDK